MDNGGYRDFHRRAIVNNGVVNWNSGYIRSGSDGSFTNASGATFNDLQTSGYTIHNYSFGATAGTFVFTNNGTYVRNAANTTYVDIPFHNNGTVSVLQGDLQFRSGGTLAANGSIAAAASTNVYFTSGYTVSNGASLTGAGGYWLTGGTLTLTGQLNVGTFTQSGGSLAGTGTINGIFNWTGGDWNGPATTTIASGASLSMTNGGYHDFNQRAVVNNGAVNWRSGYVRSSDGGSFTNTGTFNDVQASGYSIHNSNPSSGSFVFTNNGTYVRNAANTTYLDTTFNNNGTLTLTQGDFQLRGGGTNSASGVFNTSAGASVRFTNDYTIANGSALTGAGDYHLTGGTFTVSGTITLGTFHHSGGRLAGSQTFASGTVFNWSGGDWNATAAGATTTIASGATLNLTGSYRDFDYRAVINQGTVNWSSGYLHSGHGGSFTNAAGATFNDLNSPGYTINGDLGGASSFTNAGVYHKATTGTTAVHVPFTNTGTLNIAAGTLIFTSTFTNSGAIALSSGATLQSPGTLAMGTSALTGTGTINAASVTAGGLVSPGNSAGTLTLTGNLTLLSTSTLLFELGGGTPGTGYDLLTIGGNGVIAGNLSLLFLNGYQTSVTPSATFTVLTTGGTLTGSFANIANGQQLFTADGAGLFKVNYGPGSAFAANSVVLSNFVAVPEPSTWALMVIGTLVVAAQVYRRRRAQR